MFFSRCGVRALVALVCVSLVLLASGPVSARSTAAEVAQARAVDREIVAEQGTVDDPLLNAWVQRVAAREWPLVARKDLPYTVKILDENAVNAFTIGGGAVYINEGALDFVSSDDELAGILGHEIGHNEHRHPLALRQRSEILSLLFGVAALLVPATLGAGSFAQESLMAHASRTDEYQADQYGLNIMKRAGYDPDAMLSFLQRLGNAGNDSEVAGYLADHPGVPQRLRRLATYPELDAQKRDPARLLADAWHDAQTARYAVAAAQFQRVLLALPHAGSAWLGLGEMQLALGLPNRARQSFAAAERDGDRATQLEASAQLRVLPFAPLPRSVASPATLADWRGQVVRGRRSLQKSADQTLVGLQTDRLRLASLTARLNELSQVTAGLPDASQAEDANDSFARALEQLGRRVNASVERLATVVDGVGSLAPGHESGVFDDIGGSMQEIADDLSGNMTQRAALVALPPIPTLLATLTQADTSLQAAVNQVSVAVPVLNHGLDVLSSLLQRAKMGQTTRREQRVALAELDAAFARAQAAADAYNQARALVLETKLTLLGVDATPASAAAFRHALALRCGIEPPALHSGQQSLTAGALAAATIVAADKRSPDPLTLEIFLGLIYLDYTDTLPKAE